MSEIIETGSITKKEDAKSFINSYWTGRAKGFADLRKEELASNKYLRWKEEIQRHMAGTKTLSILDVGCGPGFFSILLSKLGHKVTAIDLTESMIEEGRRLAEEEGCDITFLTMDAEHLEFPDESFDMVISRNLMWNLPNPKEAYREWLRVLKKDGRLLNYDAEYAKDHHKKENLRNSAHQDLSKETLMNCHKMYHMLEVSAYSRPIWDEVTLQELGASYIETDMTVGERIYMEEDQFYITTPMFGIMAIK